MSRSRTRTGSPCGSTNPRGSVRTGTHGQRPVAPTARAGSAVGVMARGLATPRALGTSSSPARHAARSCWCRRAAIRRPQQVGRRVTATRRRPRFPPAREAGALFVVGGWRPAQRQASPSAGGPLPHGVSLTHRKPRRRTTARRSRRTHRSPFNGIAYWWCARGRSAVSAGARPQSYTVCADSSKPAHICRTHRQAHTLGRSTLRRKTLVRNP